MSQESPPSAAPSGLTRGLGLYVLLGAVVVVYAPALDGAWLNWDDPSILQDPLLEKPLGDAVAGALTTTWERAWYPVTRLLFVALHAAGLLRPGVLHTIDLALFLGCIAGLVALLPRLGVPRAWALPAVALWALHPHRVESVAWMSATRDVLSLSLAIAAALCMWPPPGAPGRERERLTWIGHGLWAGALLAKSAIFPVAGVFWTVEAVRHDLIRATRRFGGFVALAIADGLVALWAFDRGVVPDWPEALDRWALPFYSHGMWAAGLLVPTRLAAVYPIPEETGAYVTLGIVAVVGPVLAAAVHHRATGRAEGWALVALWLLPTLPVSGLVPLAFWAADRYTLVTSLAPALLVAAGLVRGFADRRWHPAIPILTLGVLLGGASRARVSAWSSSLALWTADVSRPGEHFTRRLNLGSALGGEGRFEEALTQYQRAEDLAPHRWDVRAHRMFAQLVVGGWNDERAKAGAALEPPPQSGKDWVLAAFLLIQVGEPALAEEAIEAARALGAPDEVLTELERALDALD